MSKYNEQHATTMLNALIGTDTLIRHDEEVIDKFAEYIKKNFRIGVNTIDEIVKEFKERNDQRRI